MAKIKEITVEEVRNLGNYQTRRVGLVAIVQEEENPKEVVQQLQGMLREMLYPPVAEKIGA